MQNIIFMCISFKERKMKRNYSCICGVRPEKVFGPKNAFLGTPALFDTTYILSGRPILMIQGVPFRNFVHDEN